MRGIAPWLLLLACGSANAQAWGGIIAPARGINWTTVGIPGGIPTRTTVCANLTSGASTATIQSAMDGCASGEVVSFGAGTYTLTSSIHANKGIVLRGQGPTQTTIIQNVGTNILLGLGNGGQGGIPGTPVQTSWTGGLTRGSTVLTVASTTNLRAGQTIILDELNAAWVYPDTTARSCTTGNSCGRNDSPAGFSGSASRAQGQMTKIVSIDSATQITIRDPVGYTHTAALTPQVFSWSNNGVYGNIEYAGVEDLSIQANTPPTFSNHLNISFPFCDYCWVKNVQVTETARSAVLYYYSYGGVIRDSYISTSNTDVGSTQYGFELIMSANTLIENNISYNITAPLMPESSYGLVVAYNYFYNTVSGNMMADIEPHLSHNSFHLYEGNEVGTILYDTWWGSGSHNTSFRNRVTGTRPNKTNYRSAMKLYAYQRYNNLIANVLGTPGVQSRYSCDDLNVYGATDGNIYELGGLNGCGDPLETQDSVTRTSLVRWGNWDSVTYSANGNTNGIRYCTGSGVGNSACTESETASSDGTFPGLSSPLTTFPSSLYNGATGRHSSCGTGLSFWKNPGSGYCPMYPPIGPDVTCSVSCESGIANHAAKIPAQLCYENTAKDGNGFLTAFDADECYSADPAVKPNAPTGGTVN